MLQCSGTTLRVHLRRPLVFLVVPTCWETRFSSRRYTTYFFLSSFFDHHTSHPARHDARILLMSASLMPSEFFHRRFYLLKACFLYVVTQPLFVRQDYKQVGCKATLFLFLFGPTCMLFDLSIALRLRHDLSKVDAPTPRTGACETWVPLGPHRPGSQPSPTSGSGLLEHLPTCQWAQST
jgi:hypothetical protein